MPSDSRIISNTQDLCILELSKKEKPTKRSTAQSNCKQLIYRRQKKKGKKLSGIPHFYSFKCI